MCSAVEALIVFDKCVTKERRVVKVEEGKRYTEEVHYNYDFIEDFQDLFIDQGPKVLPEQYDAQLTIQTEELPRNRQQGKHLAYFVT